MDKVLMQRRQNQITLGVTIIAMMLASPSTLQAQTRVSFPTKELIAVSVVKKLFAFLIRPL
jgi:hypothetical protein